MARPVEILVQGTERLLPTKCRARSAANAAWASAWARSGSAWSCGPPRTDYGRQPRLHRRAVCASRWSSDTPSAVQLGNSWTLPGNRTRSPWPAGGQRASRASTSDRLASSGSRYVPAQGWPAGGLPLILRKKAKTCSPASAISRAPRTISCSVAECWKPSGLRGSAPRRPRPPAGPHAAGARPAPTPCSLQSLPAGAAGTTQAGPRSRPADTNQAVRPRRGESGPPVARLAATRTLRPGLPRAAAASR